MEFPSNKLGKIVSDLFRLPHIRYCGLHIFNTILRCMENGYLGRWYLHHE